MTFYMGTTTLTELMMLAMILHVLFYSGLNIKQKSWFLLIFISIMVCSVSEFIIHSGYYKPSWAVALTAITSIQFAVGPMIGAYFAGALGLRKGARYFGVLFFLHYIFEIVASPFGIVFYFTEEGFMHGPYFSIYEAFYLASLLYMVISMIVASNRFRRRDIWTICMVLIILLFGVAMMAFYRFFVSYLAISICACLCYIYYNDLIQQDIHAEIAANQKKVSNMQSHIISGLANLIENRDTETGEHITRTSAYVKILARDARKDSVYTDAITDHFITLLHDLAPLHDIGKIVVSDQILKKPGKLTPEEFEEMKKHAAVGGKVVREVLNGITDEECKSFAADIATYHHERWDGNGYPNNLKGEEIPLSARIMAIADVFDALVSKRCYKDAMPVEEAFGIIEKESGSHFDPNLTEVFLRHKEDFVAVFQK
ncbi:MAG: HD domain-containing protein [Clostridia bacterium]|nr:HD domain-containing protein [Clostridia bacterium]